MSKSARLSPLIIGLLLFSGCCFLWVACELLYPDGQSSSIQQGALPTPAEGLEKDNLAVTARSQIVMEQQQRPQPFLTRGFLEESLSRLAANGSDLSLPMPSHHRIRAESRRIARNVTQWGQENGFAPSPISVTLGHGGVEFFEVDLVFTAVPDVSAIRQQGAQISAGVAQFPGADYFTWVGEIMSPLPEFTAIEHRPEQQMGALN